MPAGARFFHKVPDRVRQGLRHDFNLLVFPEFSKCPWAGLGTFMAGLGHVVWYISGAELDYTPSGAFQPTSRPLVWMA